MKLASLKFGGRDGRLVVVSTDLTLCTEVPHIAPTLRAALDDWAAVAPRLQRAAEALASEAVPTLRFREHDAMAPLPRAAQWADGSAYVNHVELVRRARGAEMPESFWSDPLMYMGAPDAMIGARDPILAANADWGIDFEAEVAVITEDVPMGIAPEDAGTLIRLVVLVNDVSFRALIPNELAKGFGFLQSKGVTAVSPVAVTPDELGEAWDGGKVSLPMLVTYNGQPFGKADAGTDMTFDFPRLIAHAARTRPLSAGTMIGSGTVSNRLDDGPGRPIAEGGVGYSCIAELRTVETLAGGAPETPFMAFGDTVRIEMKDDHGHSIFGAIEQTVEQQKE